MTTRFFRFVALRTRAFTGRLWLCCALLLGLAALPALAQTTIGTISSWDGSTAAYSFGFPNGAAADTYGQTFTVPAGYPAISDINFRLGYNFGQGLSFTGYLMAWDGSEAVGDVLFQSAPASVDSSTAGLATYDFPIPNVGLYPGHVYVFFLLANPGSGGPATAQFGVTGSNATYTGGNFVFTNSGGTMGGLYSPWTQTDAPSGFGDSAFQATFNAITPAVLESPAPGSTLTGPSTTFTWSTGVGAGAYQFWLGSTGVGSNNLCSSGPLGPPPTMVCNNLPLNGEKLYARLYTLIDGSWTHIDYTYFAASPAVLTAPGTSGILPGPVTTFTWSAPPGAAAYQLWLGTTGVNSNNLLSTGVIHGNTTTRTNMPTNGETVYARLFTDFGGTWTSVNYTFSAATQSAPVSPAVGATLPGPVTTFTWSAATGSSANAYQFWLGSTGVGSNDVYSSGVITATAVTRTNMPSNGETLYARLYTDYNGTWVHQDYTLIAAAASVLTNPTPSTTLAGSTVTFDWSTATGSATQYQLWLGTTGVGSNDLYSSGATTATTVTRTNLPTNGETIYARLYTNYNGTWVHTDYSYTAYGSPPL